VALAKYSKAEVEEAIATIYGRLSEGKDDREVIEEMGISAEDYAALKAAMFEAKADQLRGTPIEHIYVTYMINQIHNVKDLTGMITDFKTTKQYNAMVGAVRVRSEIYDKLVKTGQDMGLIRREPNRTEIIAGVVVADLTNQQLKKAIVGELADLNKLMKRYGDGKIVEMEPGDLHYGEALPPRSEPTSPTVTASRPAYSSSEVHIPKGKDEAPRHTKARTAKVSGGRRVVKT
jgi:hypothetical protein